MSCESSLMWSSPWDLLVIWYCNYLFNRTIVSSKNSSILAIIWVAKKESKEASNKFFDCYSDISTHLYLLSIWILLGIFLRISSTVKGETEVRKIKNNIKKFLIVFSF